MIEWLLLLLMLTLAPTGVFVVVAVGSAAGELVRDDFYRFPKYEIVARNTPFSNESSEGVLVRMKTPAGAVLSCRLPAAADELEFKMAESEADKIRVSRKKSYESFLSESKCYYYITGWWTYEICPRKSIRQFHRDGESNVIQDEFILGLFNETLETNGMAVIDLFADGTRCDLSDEPRSARITYECGEVPNELVYSVEEVSTCKYAIVVKTPKLCIQIPNIKVQCHVDEPAPKSNSDNQSSSHYSSSSSSFSSFLVPNNRAAADASKKATKISKESSTTSKLSKSKLTPASSSESESESAQKIRILGSANLGRITAETADLLKLREKLVNELSKITSKMFDGENVEIIDLTDLSSDESSQDEGADVKKEKAPKVKEKQEL